MATAPTSSTTWSEARPGRSTGPGHRPRGPDAPCRLRQRSWAVVSPVHVVGRNYSVIGVYAGGYSRAFLDYAQDEMLRLFEEGRITTTVTRTVPFDQLPDALEELSQRSTLGRSVLVSSLA